MKIAAKVGILVVGLMLLQPSIQQGEKDCDCDSEKKETKSLYSTQVAPVQLQARLPDQTVEVLYENPHVNSIFGHQPWRQAYEKGRIHKLCEQDFEYF